MKYRLSKSYMQQMAGTSSATVLTDVELVPDSGDNTEINDLKKQITGLRVQNSELIERNAGLYTQLADQVDVAEALKTCVVDRDLYRQECEALADERDLLKKRNIHQESTVQSALEESRHQKKEIERITKENIALHKSLDCLGIPVQPTPKDTRHQPSGFEELIRGDYTARRETEIERLTKENAALTDERDDLKKRNIALVTSVNELATGVRWAEAEKNYAAASYKRLGDKLVVDMERLAKVESNVDLNFQVETLRKDNKTMLGELVKVRQDRRDLTEENAELEKALETMSRSVSDARGVNERLRTHNLDLELARSELARQADDLSKELVLLSCK